jgi:hypothetical protein
MPEKTDNDTSQNNELVFAINQMTEEVSGLRSETKHLSKLGAKNRMLIKVLGASVVFDVLLSLGLVYAVDRVNKANSAQLATCRAGNVARAVQSDLWNFVLTIPPAESMTPEEVVRRAENVAKFKVYIGTAFAQRNCKG